jgi:hypothetical protein
MTMSDSSAPVFDLDSFAAWLPPKSPLRSLSNPELGVCLIYVGALIESMPDDLAAQRAAMPAIEARFTAEERQYLAKAMKKLETLDSVVEAITAYWAHCNNGPLKRTKLGG